MHLLLCLHALQRGTVPLCLGVHNMRRRGCRARPARLNPAPSRLSDVPTYVVVPRLLAHQLGVERRHQVHGRDEAGGGNGGGGDGGSER
ncbi:hypothetical protein M1N18_01430 [Dehalococcoidales bacterium]|nr:hypothetical protein [Dehalococcoidales bacterium]